MRIGIPIESGWYRVIYAPGCAFAPPGAFFGLECRGGRPYSPVPAAANVGADAERSCSRRRSVTDAACPLRVLIGPQVLVLLGSSTERRCAERRDLSGGRERRDGQLITKILRGQFRTTVRTSPLSFPGRPKPFFSFWQRKKRTVSKRKWANIGRPQSTNHPRRRSVWGGLIRALWKGTLAFWGSADDRTARSARSPRGSRRRP